MPNNAQSDDDLQPIRALNDFLFCPRRCALHFIERLWVETAHTLEGTHAHQRVHASPSSDESEGVGRVLRGLWLRSDRLRLIGVADLVEFRPQPYPIEYKRGRRRKWDNDEVQLCAQALCLEEMLSVDVPAGAIFHVKSKRRREVVFDAKLRQLTEDAIVRFHELIKVAQTPEPIPHPKCKACSLNSFCLPELVARPDGYQLAALGLFSAAPT